MIIVQILNLLVSLLNLVLGWLPTVTTLPQIAGVDVDSAMVTGMGEARTFFLTFWPFQIVLEGFLFLLGYYIIKMTLKLFLGSRIK